MFEYAYMAAAIIAIEQNRLWQVQPGRTGDRTGNRHSLWISKS